MKMPIEEGSTRAVIEDLPAEEERAEDSSVETPASSPIEVNGPSAPADAVLTQQSSQENEGPLDAAVKEPDAIPLITRDTTPPSVEPKRKEDLLARARADRRKWVQLVPLPFRSLRDPNDFWTLEDRLAKFKSTAACQRLPSLLPILEKLYGMDKQRLTSHELADRLQAVVRVPRFPPKQLITMGRAKIFFVLDIWYASPSITILITSIFFCFLLLHTHT
jgi:hypothetical protein